MRYGFHPEARVEYLEAINYYVREASPIIALAFVEIVETAAAALVKTPTRWRIVEEPEIRRCKLRRFPFVLHYRCEPRNDCITIYAVMHTSREPGYWRHRLD